MKKIKIIVASLLLLSFSLSHAFVGNISLAKTKVVKKISGKHTSFSVIKSVKLQGSKITIKTADSKKAKTYKIVAKPNFYHAEEKWFDCGKTTKKKFVKLVKTAIMNQFPAIHIWTKNNTIISVGESA